MLEKLLKGIARALRRHKIPYMIIGGQAVLLYGSIRLTRDVDITLGIDIQDYKRILTVAKDVGLKVLPKRIKDFLIDTHVLPMEHSFSGFRIDFIFSNTAYEQQAIKRAKKISIQNEIVRFATLEDLIIHKVFAGRAIDLEDVKTLLIQNKQKIKTSYIRFWLREFSGVSAKEDLLILFDRLWKSAS